MSNKRSFNDEEENNSRLKRVCTSYDNGLHPLHSVSIKLTLNQLLNSSEMREMAKNDSINSKSICGEKQCFGCQRRRQSIWFSCHFCERNVCDECSLNCFRCLSTYCGLCAVKSYEYSHQNNVGVCLSCSS